MTVLITGGAKNGKSDFAQELAVKLADGGPHYYVATMIPCDEEDRDRIRRHLKSREGLDFETLECGRNILSCLNGSNTDGTFLLDSTTALLMNELFPDPTGDTLDEAAALRCADDLAAFVRSVKHAVIVSDAIYADAARYDKVTNIYRKCLAHIDRTLAAVCDTVIEVVTGNLIIHKGELNP